MATRRLLRCRAAAAWKSRDDKGTSESVKTEVNTTHQNAISQLSIHSGSAEAVTKFASSGVDGRLCVWDLQKAASTAGLTVV